MKVVNGYTLELRVENNELRVASCEQRVARCKLRVANGNNNNSGWGRMRDSSVHIKESHAFNQTPVYGCWDTSQPMNLPEKFCFRCH